MKAEIKTEVTKKMVEVEQKEEMVVLTFTKKEAQVVADLFGCVSSQGNIRNFTNKVFYSLLNIGIKHLGIFSGGVSTDPITDKNYGDLQ